MVDSTGDKATTHLWGFGFWGLNSWRREEKEEMVFSSVGSLSEISLLPFHHLKINNNNNNNNKLRNSHNHHHFISIGLCQQQQSLLQFQTTKKKKKNWKGNRNNGNGFFNSCSSTDDFTTSTTNHTSSMEESSMTTTTTTTTTTEEPEAVTNPAPVQRKRIRYRKEYPGENKGIVEEMRFVTMRLHNKKKKRRVRIKGTIEEGSNDEGETLEEEEKEKEETSSDKDSHSGNDSDNDDGDTLEPKEEEESLESSDKNGEILTWQPSIGGFLKYLVDSKLVFETLERIVNESDNISYTCFRNTGLERSAGLAKDLEWFHQQNNVIPEPSKPGVDYARYLEQLAAKSAPMFLCHYYNIYFAHVSGGQVIAKQVSEKVLEGKELEFNTWEGDAFELLKNVRDNLNNLGGDWPRDVKNKCLKEAAKSFRYLGQIVRLIVL